MDYSDWEDHATRREHMHDWSIASEMWLQAYNAAVDDEHNTSQLCELNIAYE